MSTALKVEHAAAKFRRLLDDFEPGTEPFAEEVAKVVIGTLRKPTASMLVAMQEALPKDVDPSWLADAWDAGVDTALDPD